MYKNGLMLGTKPNTKQFANFSSRHINDWNNRRDAKQRFHLSLNSFEPYLMHHSSRLFVFEQTNYLLKKGRAVSLARTLESPVEVFFWIKTFVATCI